MSNGHWGLNCQKYIVKAKIEVILQDFLRTFISMLEVKDLSKSYGQQIAVNQLSFSLKKGEILGFLGPNGAGKSTTMKMITTYLPPDSGEVILDGFELSTQALELKKRIGYLPEHNPLYYDMYVLEFLDWMARLHKIEGKEKKKRIEQLIEQTGLGPEQHKKIGLLSKGYKQRVGIAQAMLHDPLLLILDEPTTGLDPNQIIDIRNLIQEIGKEKAVVFSSHILSEAEAVADRIFIISKGNKVLDSPTASLYEKARNETIVEVSFDKEDFDPSAISALDAVTDIQKLDPKTFRIISAKDTDIRQFLFEETVRQKLCIYQLNRKVYTLEDIFRQLTMVESQ